MRCTLMERPLRPELSAGRSSESCGLVSQPVMAVGGRLRVRWLLYFVAVQQPPPSFCLPWVLSGILVSWVFAGQVAVAIHLSGCYWSSLATVERPRTAQGRSSQHRHCASTTSPAQDGEPFHRR